MAVGPAVEHNVEARMRDGVILRSDIYWPATRERRPALLLRTPYDKGRTDFGREAFAPVARGAAERGYVVVIQDIRGRFASDGDFVPFFAPGTVDGQDGYDTVQWVASLDRCNGQVGTFGDSYGAWTQWELARAQPPNLVAMFPSGLPASALDYPILRVGRRILWLIGRMAPDTRVRDRRLPRGPLSADSAYELWNSTERGKWYWFLPMAELPRAVLGGLADHFYELVQRMPVDYLTPQRDYSNIRVPALHLTGWFDIDAAGSIDHYTAMQEARDNDSSRGLQRLIVGPWTHMDPFYELPSRLGALDFGPSGQLDYVDILVEWFDEVMGRNPDGIRSDAAPVKYFLMGANSWRSEDQWPPRDTEQLRYYLSSTGVAGSPSAHGELRLRPAADTSWNEFDYDPRDPVMSTYLADAYYAPLDQRALAERPDVLVYRSEPLDSKVDVVGPVHVELWASSTAADTDFTVKLADERPDGAAIAITSGLIRARYREGVESPLLLDSGRVYCFKISLQPTAYRFAAGHRLRLHVTSSDFPDYDRNHNIGANDLYDPRLVTARQTVFYGGGYPSHLSLSVTRR